MPSFKQVMLVLHRWLGLVTGLVVLVISVTGCLFVFQHEISQWTRGDLIYTSSSTDSSKLPVAKIHDRAADALDVERLPYGLTTYRDSDQNWTALNYQYSTEDAWTYFGMAEEYKTAYIDPYTGTVAGIVDEKKDFFQIMKGIHWSLLLSTPIGQPIVVWSTMIFLILLVTGMVLWWPKKWNRSGRRKSFSIKWNGSWRRVNYDLHNVLGFYFLTLALIIGLTGLYWYFPSAQKSLYFLMTGEFSLPPTSTEEVTSTPPATVNEETQSPLQAAYRIAWSEYPEAYSIAFTAPADSQGTINATVRPDGETYYARTYLQFDQYTGQLLGRDEYAEKNAGEKLLAMNYDIHVGAIGGLPGKIIAFFSSLICASLPVTGFIIWFDRKKRQWAENKADAEQEAESKDRTPPKIKAKERHLETV